MRQGNMRALVAGIVGMALASHLAAEVKTSELDVDVQAGDKTVKQHRLILENDFLRVAVVPDPGGTVVEFVNKKTGTDFVAGADRFARGSVGYCWKDFETFQDLGLAGKRFMHFPYEAEFRDGDGYKSIAVRCEKDGQRVEREMCLGDDARELTVLIRLTNTSDKPQRLQVRFHPYSMVGDPYAENSCVITPLVGGELGKTFVGQGLDGQYISRDGYWLAANWKSGEGLWMTYRKDQSQCHMTWTDYNYSRHPMRGAFVAEPFPMPILGAPGESVEYAGTYCPYSAEDKPGDIPLGVLSDPAEKERARKFLALVKENAAAIGPYSMQPNRGASGNAEADKNRFSFNNLRRDRVALRSWGICDAMCEASSLQDQPVRCRYYARLFEARKEPVRLTFRARAIDALGKVAREQSKPFTLTPEAREIDVRDDMPLTGLSDGLYTIVLDVLADGEDAALHHYEDSVRLVGQAKPEYERKLAARKSAGIQERPFVTALRKIELPAAEAGQVIVSIGVEEAGGMAREGWPVRLGVPFAQGALPKQVVVELPAPDGRLIPAQIEPMSTWLDGSLKWLLVNFPADVPANGHVFYTLRAKAGKSEAAPTLVAETAEGFAVDTGALKMDWPKTAGAGDGLLFGLLRADDLWWADEKGQLYTFRLQGEGAGWTVEENGPNRAVVKAVGWYFNAAERPVCMGELRMEYYRGKAFARLYHTVMYAGDPWHEELGGYGIRFAVPGGAFAAASVEVDGKVVGGKQLGVYQRNSDACEVTADGAGSTGRRSGGGVRIVDAQGKKTGFYHRDFWRMAPKALAVDAAAGTVSFSYWPRRAGTMSFLPRDDGWITSSSTAAATAVGMSRAHEIVIDFAPAAGPDRAEAVFGEPVIAVVPPRYLARTKAALHLSPYDPERNPRLEQWISDTIDLYDAHRELFGWYGEWYYGGLPNQWVPAIWRWRMYGRYACILNEEDIVHAPWLCYLRSGDRKYLKFAESNTRQLMEVGTMRWNPVWSEEVGLSRRHFETVWQGNGDTGHSMLDPFVDYWFVTGYRPAWEAAQRMAGAMGKVGTGSWRYISNPVAGLARMYLETQEPWYKEQADRIWTALCYPEQNTWWVADHGDRAAMWYSQINPQCKALWKEWALNPAKEGRFGGADVMSALYLETGDAKYVEAIRDFASLIPPDMITQYVLAGLRARCYAGEALAAGRE